MELLGNPNGFSRRELGGLQFGVSPTFLFHHFFLSPSFPDMRCDTPLGIPINLKHEVRRTKSHIETCTSSQPFQPSWRRWGWATRSPWARRPTQVASMGFGHCSMGFGLVPPFWWFLKRNQMKHRSRVGGAPLKQDTPNMFLSSWRSRLRLGTAAARARQDNDRWEVEIRLERGRAPLSPPPARS